MAMIPTIAEVVDGLLAGTVTRDQALAWIDQHIAQAVDASYDRDAAANLAMQMLMADRDFLRNAKNAMQDCNEAVAVAAYRQADAMKNARTT